MKLGADIDIDLPDRDKLLSVIKHIPAAMHKVTPPHRHPSGVYVTDIPYDPETDMSVLDYEEAEERGYFKLDLLNMHVYGEVRDEEHLKQLMKQDPDWSMLADYNTVEQLVHLSNSWSVLRGFPEPVNSIPRLAMCLAVIRPSKRHLVDKPWAEISKTIWDRDQAGYVFRKAHAVSYAMLVVVHMNLIREKQQERIC